jgi:hypothetical protein
MRYSEVIRYDLSSVCSNGRTELKGGMLFICHELDLLREGNWIQDSNAAQQIKTTATVAIEYDVY